MLLPYSVVALLLPTLALSASPPSQLYFSPPPPPSSSSSSSPQSPISLSAAQANAVLAHHLGVSSYVDLPLSSSKQGAREWEEALYVSPSSTSKFIIVLDCPKQGCNDLIPTQTPQGLSKPYTLPSLPSNSYLAAISLHLHRLADTLGLDAESKEMRGLKKVVEEGLKSVAGWQGWVGQELGSWIGYDTVDRYRTQVEPTRSANGGILSELDFLDASGKQLTLELEQLVSITDSFNSDSLPKIIIVHLKGLKDIAANHSPSSSEYRRAQSLLQQTLSATISSYQSHSHSSSSQTILLALPPPNTPLLRKRQPWLQPFSSGISKYVSQRSSNGRNLNQNHKRSVFVDSPTSSSNGRVKRADDDDDEKKNSSTIIVPTSSRCFKSLEELNEQTAECLGRGQGVKGISTRSEGNKECWVCKCESTTDDETGKRTWWAGEGCEKKDLSGSFSLLFFSSLGLVLILMASVSLLYKIGTVELPGTLSAVSGNGGMHAKRD